MRPVERDAAPTRYDHQGRIRAVQDFEKYGRARRYLIDTIGPFCSYCEQHLCIVPVEHIDPKFHHPNKEVDWENFLLACTNCNSTKGDTNINDTNRSDYFWPHLHNTFLPFSYDHTGIVKPKLGISASDSQRAERSIRLMGLGKWPPNPGTVAYEEASDLRFERRVTAWKTAAGYEEKYRAATDEVKTVFRECFVTILELGGFFSVWMTVFKDHPDVKELIVNAFRGTARHTCFDANFNPIHRNGPEI